MDEQSHIVSGIYTSRAEAQAVHQRLLERGLPGEQMIIVDNVPTSASLWIYVSKEPNDKGTVRTGPIIASGMISL